VMILVSLFTCPYILRLCMQLNHVDDDGLLTVSSSDYVNWLCSLRSGAVCAGGVYYVATNRTEALVNESRA